MRRARASLVSPRRTGDACMALRVFVGVAPPFGVAALRRARQSSFATVKKAEMREPSVWPAIRCAIRQSPEFDVFGDTSCTEAVTTNSFRIAAFCCFSIRVFTLRSIQAPQFNRFTILQRPEYGRILEPAAAAWRGRLDYTQRPLASSANQEQPHDRPARRCLWFYLLPGRPLSLRLHVIGLYTLKLELTCRTKCKK